MKTDIWYSVRVYDITVVVPPSFLTVGRISLMWPWFVRIVVLLIQPNYSLKSIQFQISFNKIDCKFPQPFFSMLSEKQQSKFILSLAMFQLQLLMDPGQVDNDVPSSQYNCPMMDIDLGGNDLDAFSGVDDWQTCAHICNIAYESNCLFWTWSGNATWEEGSWWNNRCLLKSSDSGMRPWPGAISGQRGCL